MSDRYEQWAAKINRLHGSLAALEPLAARVDMAPPDGQEWFELLERKLLPQFELPPLLVVAVVGGTNIGKSLLFNQLTGECASAVSPLAAGTKHPVCLVPAESADPVLLQRLLEGFEIAPWRSPDDALRDASANRLFWRVGDRVPSRLLLLDTPDIDSDVEVNWERARMIRRVADVLVAVLTQQKYNDAAVKQFFREAVAADKPIVVIFNQCDLEADRPYWPEWLATFCGETGARPELVYVAPFDRAAAAELRLPVHGVGTSGRDEPSGPRCLRDDLASLHFDAIKIRTFRGALVRVLDGEHGAPAYLAAIRAAAEEFETAAGALSTGEMARVQWPTLPASILVDEIRAWWDSQRVPWSHHVHGFYRGLGRVVTWPFRTAYDAMAQGKTDPAESLRRQERDAVVRAVEAMLDNLDRLARLGTDAIKPHLRELLGGHAREDILARVLAAHDRLPPIDDGYREYLHGELDAWKQANPGAIRFLRSLDHALAIARPAITISLAVSGWIVAGELVSQTAVELAGQTAGGLATEAAIAGGITGGGEAIVTTTSEGVRHAAGRLFVRLQSRYAKDRAAWLAGWLDTELLGGLLSKLRAGAEVPRSDAFRAVEESLTTIREDGAF
ncbi:MAG: GTPase domain-containing protein [Pirellulaceae bacterium]|nr:GTPase domain-containing protein [Pirellulaceae bacterium]